jgi:hypothetical protein
MRQVTATVKTITTKIKEKLTDKDAYVFSCAELNALGEEFSRREFDENGNVILQSVTCYNDKNQKNGQNVFDAQGILLYKTKFFYKQDGKIGSEEYTYVDGQVLLKTYFYNGNSLMVRTIDEDDEEKERIVYEYGLESRKITSENEYGSDGKIFRQTEYVYDEVSGKLKEKKVTDLCGISKVIKYGYDSLDRVVSEDDGKILKTFEYNY